jgi:hypothetical protein
MIGTIAVAAIPAPPVLPATGGGSPRPVLPLLFGTLALILGVAMLRVRSLIRH